MAKLTTTDKEKKEYWRKKMNIKLTKAYSAMLPCLQELAMMGNSIGIEKKDLEAGIVEVGEGFNTLKALIDGKKTPDKIKIRVGGGRK